MQTLGCLRRKDRTFEELIRPPIFATRQRQTVRGFLGEKKRKKRDYSPYGRVRARAAA